MLKSLRNSVTLLDWILAFASAAIIGYIISQGDDFGDRAVNPEHFRCLGRDRVYCPFARSNAPDNGHVMPVVAIDLSGICTRWTVSSAAVDSSWL